VMRILAPPPVPLSCIRLYKQSWSFVAVDIKYMILLKFCDYIFLRDVLKIDEKTPLCSLISMVC
jgi:hypothetical protein